MRIAIMGAGGLGGFYGGMLARSGEDVKFIARGAHLQAMLAKGLTVKSTHLGEFTIPVKATTDPAEIGPVELVIVCVKAYDTDHTAELIRPMIGPETVVMSVQNGVDNEDRIADAIGHDHVIGAVAIVNSSVEEPGVISQVVELVTMFGELDGGTSPRLEQLLLTFKRAGLNVEIRPNIRTDMWEKFLGNCAINGISALTRLPLGPLLDCSDTRALIKGLIEEAEAVGRAGGIALREGVADYIFGLAEQYPPSARASMIPS